MSESALNTFTVMATDLMTGEAVPMTIVVVPDEPCPGCRAMADDEDPALDFPNRPKVQDEDGVWWWRCYNPACAVDLYDPETRRTQ